MPQIMVAVLSGNAKCAREMMFEDAAKDAVRAKLPGFAEKMVREVTLGLPV